MKRSPTQDGVQEIELDSWKEFLGLVCETFLHAPAYIFRGQTSYDWTLESSLDRYERLFPTHPNLGGGNPREFNGPPLSRKRHLSAFRHAIRGRRGNCAAELDEDQCWALGQHYGLKTPLLDWTLSPFAALFFAFEQPTIHVDGAERHPEFRGIYAFSYSAIQGRKAESDIRLVSPRTEENVRVIGQSGLFLKMPCGTNVEDWIKQHHPGHTHGAYLQKIKVPSADRDACLKTLNKMNINYRTVYPDLEGAAKHVNSLWQPGYSDMLAWAAESDDS